MSKHPRQVDPRKITPHEKLRMPKLAADLAKRMRRQGWPSDVPPIVVTSKMRLVDGHHRLAGALRANLTRVPAYVLDHETFFLIYEESDKGILQVAAEMLGFKMPHNRSTEAEVLLARKVGKIVRKWTQSRESYAILDAHVDGATDWGAGGCALLATALTHMLSDGNLMVILGSGTMHQHLEEVPQHFVVDWLGVVLDYKGATLPGRKLARFEREWRRPFESATLELVEPHHLDLARQHGIVWTEAGVEAVISSLRPLIARVLPEVG